jgi:mRNA interferase MazF
MKPPRRGDVFLANLDPVVGREIRKTRPVVIVSPDEMNRFLGTVIAVPLTSTQRDWPTRVAVRSGRKTSFAALDQIRVLSVERLIRRTGGVDPAPLLVVLREMFAD